MRILSLDLSTKSTGWGIFNNETLQDYGCITSSSVDVIKRIKNVINKLQEILQTHEKIDHIVVEQVIPSIQIGKPLHVYKVLMWLQAALVFLIYDKYKTVSIQYVLPTTWRSKCGIKTGSRQRDELKKQDIAFVQQRYGINVNDDIADAICIGHSYIFDKRTFHWD